MARVILPLEPEDQEMLERVSEQTGVPVGALIFMRMKGYRPMSSQRAKALIVAQASHGRKP